MSLQGEAQIAEVPYTDTGAQVAPQVNAPDDYQRIDATPASFGGLIAKGLNEAGQGAVKAGQFFGQVAADNGTNDFQDYSNKLLYGDPSKTITGPDGKPTQDLGYLGLKGRAALDARPAVEAQLDEKLNDIRSGLQTPEQQLQFDNYSKRYRARASEQIGSHADTQANTWYGAVNKSASDLALTHIAQNADNPTELAAGIADLRSARVKDAQLAGGGPELVQAAIDGANRDGLKVQLETISVHDPARAAAILEKNKAIAGTDYEALAKQFKAASDHQTGTATADQIYKNSPRPDGNHPYADPSLPIYAQTAQAIPGGMSQQGLARTVQIESAGVPNAGANSSHKGLGQFSDATWAQYGEGSQLDPKQSIVATQKYAAANAPILTNALGRVPTDAELYLAHQQGAGGASLLLQNPNERAGDLVGDKAILQNGGDPNAPASAFTSMWTAKFNGKWTSPSGPHGQASTPSSGAAAPTPTLSPVQNIAPVDLKSAVPPPPPDLEGQQAAADLHASNALMNMPAGLSAEAQTAYKDHVNSLYAAESLGIKGQAALEKSGHDKVMSDIQARLDKGDTGSQTGGNSIYDDIDNNPLLAGARGEIVKQTLRDLVLKRTGNEDPISMGSGYLKALKGITAPFGDPNKVVDPIQILQMENNGELTKRGSAELQRELGAVKKEDGPGLVATKTAMLTYASSLLSFDQEMSYPGMPPLKDEKGREAFLSEFVPKFYAGYDNWVKQGKDPMQFLQRDNIAKLAEEVRPAKQMAMDKLIATNSTTTVADDPRIPIPEAPKNVNNDVWKTVVSSPPVRADNTHMPHEIWAKFVENLVNDPSQENINLFNSSQFGRAGYRAERIIKQLTGKDPQANLIPEERTEGVSSPLETPAPHIIGGHTTLRVQ